MQIDQYFPYILGVYVAAFIIIVALFISSLNNLRKNKKIYNEKRKQNKNKK